MKKKYLLLKIYLSLLILCIITLIVFSLLGKKTRVGYISEFKFDELHINRTLEINNLENIKNNFYKDNVLDDKAITEYIYTNKSITKYSYGFKMQYYDKIFRHSDIYNVYPDLKKLLKIMIFIENIYMSSDGSPFGYLISTKIIDFEKIDNVNYILKMKTNLVSQFIIFNLLIIFLLLFTKYYFIYENNINVYQYKINLNKKDYLFILVTFFSILSIFLLQLYIYFPGYFKGWDNIDIIISGYNNKYWNGHPVFNQVTLSFLYNLFGYSPSYFFIINLICWYLGLFIIIISLYLKYKNIFFYFLILISFIGNIWFANNYQIKDITAVNYFWLSASIILFYLLIPIKNNFIILIVGLFILILSMISRHNMIVTVYPLFILVTFIILNKKKITNIRSYILMFFNLMLIFAILLVLIFKYQPTLWIKSSSLYSGFTQHLYYLPISACAALSNDEDVIPKQWYREGIDFDYIKEFYLKNSINADAFGWGGVSTVFINDISQNEVQKVFFKAIFKHPISWLKHITNFGKHILLLKNNFRMNFNEYSNFYSDRLNQAGIQSYIRKISNLNITLFTFFYKYLIDINLYIFLFLDLLIFIILLCLIIINKNYIKNYIFIFCMSICISSIMTALIVIIFSPVINLRYIYIIVPISIMSLISFITFINDIGGFKKFFTELKFIKSFGNKK
ncbi:hypothetical protein [Brachyspira pilosicoli]|uniref:Uncharacterized protein n=1 Tax=Brachyspira pilosicoli TaxID=52584 RepID=A0A5C8EFU4_BRAPL|nr:hypothetical protein [Brachyspira pilosicoli]TXJ36348.1 hypothetical protein EPJ72_11655 [Brachyspira pilosicoli]